MVHNLSLNNSIINQFVAELRDVQIQKDRMRFRKNLERIGEIFAYEISRKMTFTMQEVTTPLGIANVPVLAEQPGWITGFLHRQFPGYSPTHLQYAFVWESLFPSMLYRSLQ